MIDLQYEQLLSPVPIKLSLGISEKTVSLRKPKLREIDLEITLAQFNIYEAFLSMTPKLYYTELLKEVGKDYWESLSDSTKDQLTMYDIILNDPNLQLTYADILDFFFLESVIFKDGAFLLFEQNSESDKENISDDSVCGKIDSENFPIIIDLIRQTCCIREKKTEAEAVQFKNSKARKLYEKIQKAKAEAEKVAAEKNKDNYNIGNVISSVGNKHYSLTPISVWELTIFQLYDAFNRLKANDIYSIDRHRVSVWGDEKKTFDASLWYKNIFAKN